MLTFFQKRGSFAYCALVSSIIFMQANLELRAVKARLTRDARDVELALLLCCLFPNKCGRGEEEAELLHGRQLLPQLLIRIHGETRRCNGYPAAAHDLCPQIVAHRVCDVIEYLHSAPPNLSHRDWLDQTCVPIITYFKEIKRYVFVFRAAPSDALHTDKIINIGCRKEELYRACFTFALQSEKGGWYCV